MHGRITPCWVLTLISSVLCLFSIEAGLRLVRDGVRNFGQRLDRDRACTAISFSALFSGPKRLEKSARALRFNPAAFYVGRLSVFASRCLSQRGGGNTPSIIKAHPSFV